ncbi:MAG: tyrosine-type recombinase/integrase, partial [Rhodospirillaceae bacterium]
MPTVKITAAFAAAPPPPPAGKAKVDYYCVDLPGLLMEVRASGQCTFYACYRDGRGAKRQLRVGRFGEVTLAQARRRVQQVRGSAALGADPAAERDQARQVPTFGEFAVRYMTHAKSHKRSWKDDDGWLRNWLLPAFAKRSIDAVCTRDISRLHSRVKDERSVVAANRVLSLVKHLFNLAIQWGEVRLNPAKGIRLFREVARARFLDPAEVRRLVAALDQEQNRTVAAFFMLLLLTGARRSEAMGASWTEVDLDRRMWTVPASRSKSGRARHITLSDSAVRLLRTLPGPEAGQHVFPGRHRGKPLNNPAKNWAAACERAGLEGVRIHDLRHSFASILAANGRSLVEIQHLLGHQSPMMTN